MNLRNVGIFAHVDAGKTTTTEQILFRSGRIRSLGSVDDGTAQTDWLEVERSRGISVRSAVTRFHWKGVQVNVVDTPGHVDFLSEVERSLRVMDGAVLIISAVEGVQAQTEVIWQALRELCIPTLIYMNKLDRIGADPTRVIGEIHRLLSIAAIPIQAVDGIEGEFVGTEDLLNIIDVEKVADLSVSSSGARKNLVEKIAEQDDALLERYFEQGPHLTDAELLPIFTTSIRDSKLFPVLFGASNRGIGIDQLMNAIVSLLPSPSGNENAPLSGVVFKLDKDPIMGRLAYVRLYEGTLRNRDTVHNHKLDIDEKVTQIRKVDGQRSEDIGILKAGDIAVVCGWSRVRIGDIVGDSEGVPSEKRLAEPLLTVQVHWRNEAEYPVVVAAFHELADEDPHLDVQWLQEDRELHLRVMGPIQIEVLAYMLMSRYGLTVNFGAPSVIYKETPEQSGEGFVAYTMPKPCWAILRFLIEPGVRGSGLVYQSIVRTESLLDRYQKEVARRVPEALEQGLRGWPVTDLKVTLIEGEHHVWHTHPLDFVVATPMGIMDGLAKMGTKLLEPMLKFRLSTPEEFGGKLMSELVVMRGEFDTPHVHLGRMEIEGRLPVATSLEFPARLGSMTKGRGTLTTFFDGYELCPPDVNAERTRRGVNPLDTSKYILATRNALSN
ncbi:translation factor GTPase family protein [Cohnella sp. WQ 127256]|uniref:GTP-binding protein n=1 Tax=Cohnella sp. WQ 127256 TaxID=2938790 RepID=UPI002119A740|nr:TetM/TetW/TetO/TetS family tetracycline resistance ribosomal protection protein [Cohnella sp. WQ 127256]